MTNREQILQAIVTLKAHRPVLGDAVVDPAIAGLRQALAVQGSDANGAAHFEGERKVVTVMFADISGFTAMSEIMDPEAVRELINGCFERLVRVIEKYGGTVEKFIGDAIMTIFGAPVAHENDPERALLAALEMMDALEEFNREREMDLGMHIGVNTGLVVAGAIGIRGHQQYGVMGDAVNLAARLEDASEKGEIIVGPDTYSQTASLFEFEALTPLRVKGKTDPIQVYRLEGMKAEPGLRRGLAQQGISSLLVGREREIAIFQECVKRLESGQGGIVAVMGEAGVGKTRLMLEIQNDIPRDRIVWLETRALSFGQTISYLPFQGLVRKATGISEDDAEADAWRKLELGITALFAAQGAEILPYLASLLTIEVRGEYIERIKYLDSEAMGHQLFLACRRFFEKLAYSQPLALVFEDIHWMDESSTRLLEHLMPLVETAPLLICYVSRPQTHSRSMRLQEVASKKYPNRYSEIALSPLSKNDSLHLFGNLLKIKDIPANVKEMILRKAEGNPFFLEEIIRSLMVSGAVTYDSGSAQWKATTQIGTINIPDTIQGVIMARVDKLNEEIKQSLRTAAVIGHSFIFQVLRGVTEAGQELEQHLVELQAIEIIIEKHQLPELEYIFKHALAHEAIYASMLKQKRRELHGRIGQCVEALFADRLEEFYGLLAYHYTSAETWEKAQHYLLKAGDQAGSIAADAEALSNYERALEAYQHAFGDAWDPLQRATLERKMGEAFFRRGEHDKALVYLERALGYLGEKLPKSKWGVLFSLFWEAFKQFRNRILPGLFVRSVDEPVSPEVEEVNLIYEDIVWIDVFTNLTRYLVGAFKSLNFSERKGHTLGMATGYSGLGLICDFMSFFQLADTYHRRGLDLAKQVGHPQAVGNAHHIKALHEMFQGHLDTTIKHGQLSVDAYRQAGFLRGLGSGLIHTVARPLIYKGELSRAAELSQDIIRDGQDGADLQVECWGTFAIGFAQERMGKIDEAIKTLKRNMTLAGAVPDHMARIETGSLLSKCRLRRGELDSALAVMEEIQQVRDKHNERKPPAITSLRNGWARVSLWAAENGKDDEKGDWLKKSGKACQSALKHGRTYRFGLPETLRLKGRHEWLRGKPSAARKYWQQSLSISEELGTRFDLGMTLLEMGCRLGDKDQVERAKAIFTEIGAKVEMQRTAIAGKAAAGNILE